MSGSGTPPAPPGACSAEMHERATAEIREALGRARRPYVSCSGGKDSMLLAALAIEVDPDIPIVHSTSGARHDAPTGKPWLPDHWPGVLIAALRTMGAGQVHTTPANLIWLDHGFDLAFIGLRRSESQRRSARMSSTPQIRDDQAESWPLAYWQATDVWGCIDAHRVPYASLYRLRSERERMHWPVDHGQRSEWSRLRYLRSTAGLPDWVGFDPERGDYCRGCGAPLAAAASPHQPGCLSDPARRPPPLRRQARRRPLNPNELALRAIEREMGLR